MKPMTDPNADLAHGVLAHSRVWRDGVLVDEGQDIDGLRRFLIRRADLVVGQNAAVPLFFNEINHSHRNQILLSLK